MSNQHPEEQRAGEATYHRAALYRGQRAEYESKRAYRRATRDLKEAQADLSVYRLLSSFGPSAPVGFFVAFIGVQPREELERKLLAHLETGEAVILPPEMVEGLEARRQQNRRIAPWVEGGIGRPYTAEFRKPGNEAGGRGR